VFLNSLSCHSVIIMCRHWWYSFLVHPLTIIIPPLPTALCSPAFILASLTISGAFFLTESQSLFNLCQEVAWFWRTSVPAGASPLSMLLLNYHKESHLLLA
jgi:hypothetical protein